MKVRIATTAGFCMGVRKAMEIALGAANKDEEPLYTYGPLIHNKQVLDLLESKNVRVVDDIRDIKKDGVSLLIRAHGIPPQKRKELKESTLKIIDATCPRVAHVQAIIRYHTKKGYTPLIVGDENHAEVIGLVGYGEGKAFVIKSPSDIASLPEGEKYFIVAQTTQDEDIYREIVKTIKEKFPDALVFDTICEATRERQNEVKTLVGQVDGMVVVGGYNSGNTRRLAQISKAAGTPTFHVETEKDLPKDELSSLEVIGVTAGASTPNWMIKDVIKELETIRGKSDTLIGRLIRKLSKFILLSNLLVALGAAALSHAAAILSGRSPDIYHPLLAFLYIYAMHVLNRFLDKGASTYNDPERANFYRKHRRFLVFSGIGAIIGALVLSFHIGATLLMVMAGLILLGVIYSIPLIPLSRRHLWKYSRLKDIPGSRTLSEAFAWTTVITLLPLLESFSLPLNTVIISSLVIFSIAFVRSAFFDLFQVQGDLIVGVETIPIILGERRTIILLKLVLVLAALVLITAPLLNLISPFGILLLISLLSMTLCLSGI